MDDLADDLAQHYDEFAMFKIYADHEGIPWRGQPLVERRSVKLDDGQSVSSLVWGSGSPEFVLLHGGGQNAHTWDSVAMALDRPLIAVDLPGHGRSDWRVDHDYWAGQNATTLVDVLAELAPSAKAIVGMSLGGLTSIRLSALRPDLVRRCIVVDVTPSVGQRVTTMTLEDRGTTTLISGSASYESLDAMLSATAAAAPHRPVETLLPGVLHNALRRPDGSWEWRYDRQRWQDSTSFDNRDLWDDVSAIRIPIMLVRGERSVFVHDEDVAEFKARQPSTRVEIVEGAGHSVQSDRPLTLAEIIRDFADSAKPTGA